MVKWDSPHNTELESKGVRKYDKEVRLDDRLIHGQVAVSWTRALDLDVLLVVNDQIVNDPMRKNALKLGVPAGVKYGFRSVD